MEEENGDNQGIPHRAPNVDPEIRKGNSGEIFKKAGSGIIDIPRRISFVVWVELTSKVTTGKKHTKVSRMEKA